MLMMAVILLTLIVSLAINLFLFLIAFRRQSDKLTDISYALSFLAIAITGFLRAPTINGYSWLIFLVVVIWAVRIGGFLLMRVLKVGKDSRFDDLREHFVRFGKFWLGQAVTAWVLMLPVTLSLYRGGQVKALTLLGVLAWAIGLGVEAAADYQKFAFKLRPVNRGTWIQEGVWRYSRHPNYFGEITVWAGIYLICFLALNTAGRVISLASPLLIAFVLLYVSGVPILERSADKRWGHLAAYKTYKQNTRLLVPLPRFGRKGP